MTAESPWSNAASPSCQPAIQSMAPLVPDPATVHVLIVFRSPPSLSMPSRPLCLSLSPQGHPCCIFVSVITARGPPSWPGLCYNTLTPLQHTDTITTLTPARTPRSGLLQHTDTCKNTLTPARTLRSGLLQHPDTIKTH